MVHGDPFDKLFFLKGVFDFVGNCLVHSFSEFTFMAIMTHNDTICGSKMLSTHGNWDASEEAD